VGLPYRRPLLSRHFIYPLGYGPLHALGGRWRSHVGQRRRTREALVTSERDTRPSWKRVSTSRLGSRCVKFDNPLISATKTAKHPVLGCKNGMRSARCVFEVSFDAAAAERAGLAPVRNSKTDSRLRDLSGLRRSTAPRRSRSWHTKRRNTRVLFPAWTFTPQGFFRDFDEKSPALEEKSYSP
jgi:hypothetical protein